MKLHSKVLLCIVLRFYIHWNISVVSGQNLTNFITLQRSETVVDTRGLIPGLFESAAKRQFQLITTPHKFGKTFNLKMLEQFVKKRTYFRTLHGFSGLREDPRCSAHFCHYPAVIYVSFKITRGGTYEDIIKELGENIGKAFGSYETVYKKLNETYHGNDRESMMRGKLKFMKKALKGQLDEEDVVISLAELSKILNDYYKSNGAFLLIDDYDSPVIAAIENNLDTGRVMNLINKIFNLLFNVEHDYIRHAVITGTIDVLDKGKFALIKRYYFPDNDRLCRYFGFIETEVETLLKRFIKSKTEFNIVMQYYNGYTGYRAYSVRENIYNTFSIVSYLRNRIDHGKEELNNYWAESSMIPNFLQNFRKGKPYRDILLKVLEMKNVTFSLKRYWSMKDLERLRNQTHHPSIIPLNTIKEEGVTHPIDSYKMIRKFSRILSYLYHHGYLTPTEEWETFRIPNKEVESYFGQLCKKNED